MYTIEASEDKLVWCMYRMWRAKLPEMDHGAYIRLVAPHA